ncbi:MAG: patatin-like phospholipase family protein [Bacteroidales bacterium]|nr:patatin-like phospholipase family protein [Bacteroidales bacterium]
MEASNTKDVALVLSSGGPRGFAYIGAIEELERRGYRITSVAGTSIGSLIGGIYAAGKLPEVKEWLFTLDAWKVFSLMDISLSMNHIVKGDKVIDAIKEIVPSVNIEDLGIPYKAVATDLFTGEEVVFSEGDLFQAIRASISIPSLFRPVKYGYRTLVDGGIVNTMPLDRVDRNGHDILVAFDVNDVDVEGITRELQQEAREEEERIAAGRELSDRTRAIIESVRHDDGIGMMEKIKLAGQHGHKILANAIQRMTNTHESLLEGIDGSYYSILSRTFSLMNHSLAKVAAERFRPDVLVKMPFDAYGEIADYAKAREISEAGRELMAEALDIYESKGL